MPEATEEWNLVSDVPLFCKNLYIYFYYGGFESFVVQTFVQFFTMIIIGACTHFLLVIDWNVNCTQDCSHVKWNQGIAFILMYIAFLSAYAVVLFRNIAQQYEVKHIYKDHLHIDDPRLYHWEEILHKFIELNKRKHYINKELNAVTFTNIIMYEKNLFILIACSEIIPRYCYSRLLDNTLRSFIVTSNLRKCGRNTLILKSRQLGALLLLVTPITLMFLFVTNVIDHIDNVRKNASNLLIPVLSREAEWKFRRFNEVDHEFEKRMNRILPKVRDYMSMFSSPVLNMIKMTLSFTIAAIFSTLFIVFIFSEEALVHVHFMGFNLLWWLAMTLAMSSLFKSSQQQFSCEYITEIIRDLEAETDLKTAWRTSHIQTLTNIQIYFKPCVYTILVDIISFVNVPVYLLCLFPRSVDEFIRIIETHDLNMSMFDVTNIEMDTESDKQTKFYKSIQSFNKINSIDRITNELSYSEIIHHLRMSI